MILKNQNQSQMNLIDPEEAFRRDSMNKSAMSSYEVELAKAIRKALASGNAPDVVAAAYKLQTETVLRLSKMDLPEEKSRLERAQDIEKLSERVEEEGPSEERQEREAYLSQAEAAYNELHGKTASKASLPNLGDVVRKSIQPSRKGDVSDIGGPQKQLRYKNSIWDSEVLARMAETKDNGERIREEKAALAKQKQFRKEAEQHLNWDEFREALDNSDSRTDHTVLPMTGNEAYKYSNKVQKNGISIFANLDLDSSPFEKIADKTEGEMVREQRKAPKEKDRSWVQQSTTTKTSSTSFFDKMIDSMLGDKE